MTKEDIDYFWNMLHHTTKEALSALHYLKHLDGTYRCLNTDTVADNEKDLDLLVGSHLKLLKDSDVPKFSDRIYWEIYAAKSPPSMDFSVSKTCSWRRRAIIAGLHLEIVGNIE